MLLAFCGVIVYLQRPLDSEDKPLISAELVLYRKKSRAVVVAISIIGILGAHLQSPEILHAGTICIALQSGLLILGKAKNILQQHCDKQ